MHKCSMWTCLTLSAATKDSQTDAILGSCKAAVEREREQIAIDPKETNVAP